MNLKNNKGKGMLLSMFGMLSTIFGMAAMSMDTSPWIYLTLCILGVLLALFGVILMVMNPKKNEQSS